MKAKIINIILLGSLLVYAGLGCKPKITTPAPTHTVRPVITKPLPSGVEDAVPGDNLTTFSLLLPRDKYDKVNALLETGDGFYLAAGVTNRETTGDTDGYIVKIDPSGKIVEEKIFKQAGDQYFYNIIPASDSGFVLVGVQRTQGREDWDIYALKINSQWKPVWEKGFGGTGADDCNEIIATRDGGYAIAGQTDSRGKGKYDAYVIKLAASGAVQWEKTYGTEGVETARTIVQTADNGYLVGGNGETKMQDDQGKEVQAKAGLIYKLDSKGNETWSKYLGKGLPITLNSGIQAADGSFLFAGMAQVRIDAQQAHYHFYALALKADGAVTWEKTYSYPGRANCLAQSIRKTPDSCFIMGGAVQHTADPGLDIALIKIDAAGNPLWKSTYDDKGGEYTNIAIPVSDGGYLVGGYTSKREVQENQGIKQDVYKGSFGCVIKLNSFGGMNTAQ